MLSHKDAGGHKVYQECLRLCFQRQKHVQRDKYNAKAIKNAKQFIHCQVARRCDPDRGPEPREGVASAWPISNYGVDESRLKKDIPPDEPRQPQCEPCESDTLQFTLHSQLP